MMNRSTNMMVKRALLSSTMIKRTTSPLSLLKSLPAKASYTAEPETKLPGELKRTTLDPTRRQPEYESPYSGPLINENKSGFDESYDLWWDDGVQREYTYFDDTPWISRSQALQWSLYFLGWAVSMYTLYRYYLQAPANSLHPMTNVRLTDAQREEALRLREERLRIMEEHNIQG